MANFGRKQVKIAAIVAPKAVVGAICLSMVASQLSAQTISSIASSGVQQSAKQSGCNAPAITELVNRLSQTNSPSALLSLVKCGELAVQPLISILNESRKNSLASRLAARALGQIGSQEAIAALLSVAQQRQSEIRDSALRAITDINPQAREAVPVLMTAVISRDIDLLTAGTEALQRIDPAVPPQVIASFWEAVLSSNAHRFKTTNTLLDQFRADQLNLADLVRVLRDDDPVLRAIAAYLLLQQGRSAETTIPQLTTALTDESSLVRDTAACALGRIGTREAITVLITQLKTGNEASQASAAIGLSSLTAEAREAMPVLIAALRDDNEQVRSMAAYGLGQMGRDAGRAIPALLGRLSDRSASVRSSATFALGQIAPDDPRVVRAIIERGAVESDLIVLDNATDALKQITPAGAPTLLKIIALDENARNVVIADAVLSRFNPQTLSKLTEQESLTLIPKVLRRYSELRYPYGFYGGVVVTPYLKKQLTPQMISRFIGILKDEDQNIHLRGNAAMIIGLANLASPLIEILEDKNQHLKLRADAAIALRFTDGSPEANSSLIEFVKSHPAYALGLRVSNDALQEYLFSKLPRDELELLAFAFATLQEMELDKSKEVTLFLNQFRQENSELFYQLVGLTMVNPADGPTMVRLLQERSQKPAICRITSMRHFLWRCR